MAIEEHLSILKRGVKYWNKWRAENSHIVPDLSKANLSGANLRKANLIRATLITSNFTKAELSDCSIYGISAWNVTLDGAKQQGLIITHKNEPAITVDNLEVAQFIYLLLHNQKIRDVIDTIGKKAVLILGRFTPGRKAILDAIREALRRRDYLPILFDFEGPENRDLTETVSTLAHMARFIIADLTEPSSLPKELEAIVPTLAVPVRPLLEGSTRPYSMFTDLLKYHWVLDVHRYDGLEGLLASLEEKVIAPAEAR
jgi:Pentapeptide repeats (8 copies)